jgi:hypothetical protein
MESPAKFPEWLTIQCIGVLINSVIEDPVGIRITHQQIEKGTLNLPIGMRSMWSS